MGSRSSPTNKIHLAFVYFSYLVFASVFNSAYRYVINPDGVSQLRLAGYLAEGHFMQSVTSGWSPLIIWVMSPFLMTGLDGVVAARMAIGLSGAWLLLSSWFLAARFDLSRNSRLVVSLIASLLISFWTVQGIASDVLFAACVLSYILLVTDTGILGNRRKSFACGLAGGLSYLAHHYSFPFFMAHFPVMMFLQGYFKRDGKGFPLKRVLGAWFAGLAGFMLIASVWIGTVSLKYGELRISSKGGVAHAIMGPKDVDRRHPFFVGGLFKPRDPYAMHVFEDPSEVEFKSWSPFESRGYFIHQLKVIKDNAVYIQNHFVNNSPFFTYAFIIGVFAFIPIALLFSPVLNRRKYLYAWAIVTFSIYCSGFLLLIARSPRRFYALMIIFLCISFHFMDEIRNTLGNLVSGHRKKALAVYLFMIVVFAFALKPGIQFFKSIKYLATHEQVNPYREIAEQIDDFKFPSPYAIIRSSQKPHTDTFIAYYIEGQLLGRPLSKDIDGITRELKAAGCRSLLVFDNKEIVEKIKKDERFFHIASRKLADAERYSHTVNINIRDHEIITGWDKEVNIFVLK